jgi:DNA-binding LytR/AlgR family response regulator
MQLDALIAEDEDLLRQSLVAQLQRLWPELRLVAECEDGACALEKLAELKPDLAFLDIRMPGITGIDVARALPEISPRTQVVFVTAYDQYAIDAFEQGAMDYLLKPVSDERLLATRERILARMQQGRPDNAMLEQLLQRLAQGGSAPSSAPPATGATRS